MTSLRRHNELLAGLEVHTLELCTALGERPIGIAGQLFAAGHLHVRARLNIDRLAEYVACHDSANAFRLVFLVRQHSTTGDLVEALARMRRMEGSGLCEDSSICTANAAYGNNSRNED